MEADVEGEPYSSGRRADWHLTNVKPGNGKKAGFEIWSNTAWCQIRTVGDGVDEKTWWTFDFTKSEAWKKMAAIRTLESVKLELELYSSVESVKCSTVRWTTPFGKGNPMRGDIKNLPQHQPTTVVF